MEDYIAWDDGTIINNKLQRACKEAAVAILKNYPNTDENHQKPWNTQPIHQESTMNIDYTKKKFPVLGPQGLQWSKQNFKNGPQHEPP